MWTVASITSVVMFGLGLALLTLVLMRHSLRYSRKRRGAGMGHESGGGPGIPRLYAARHPERNAASLADAPLELARWQVEMHELARDLKGELDTRMASLQVLMRLARQESERLEAALERAEKLRTDDAQGDPPRA